MSLITGVRFIAALVALVLGSPGLTSAQDAWTPPQGELSIATTYQWLEADRHVFSGFTDPDLTPFEIATGVDRTSNVVNAGVVQSHAVVFDGDLGLTDRLAISGTVIAVSPRYLGSFAHPSPADDGLFHPSIQDMTLGARYMFGTGIWAVTPFARASVPLRDYTVLAHASHGFGLSILELGASVGRLMDIGGTTTFLQGTYAYGISERPVSDVSLNRSRATLEGGVFLGPFSLLGQTSWKKVHGGVEWSDHAHGLDELFHDHDQLAATREWRYGGGLAFDVKNDVSVFFAVDDFIRGANTHDARTFTFGVNLAHQLFGGLMLGDDRE
jgi:hypothetical protein